MKETNKQSIKGRSGGRKEKQAIITTSAQNKSISQLFFKSSELRPAYVCMYVWCVCVCMYVCVCHTTCSLLFLLCHQQIARGGNRNASVRNPAHSSDRFTFLLNTVKKHYNFPSTTPDKIKVGKRVCLTFNVSFIIILTIFFPTVSSIVILSFLFQVNEYMGESPFTFSIPVQVMRLFIDDDKQQIMDLEALGTLLGPVEQGLRVCVCVCLSLSLSLSLFLSLLSLSLSLSLSSLSLLPSKLIVLSSPRSAPPLPRAAV